MLTVQRNIALHLIKMEIQISKYRYLHGLYYYYIIVSRISKIYIHVHFKFIFDIGNNTHVRTLSDTYIHIDIAEFGRASRSFRYIISGHEGTIV